ncbi:hypothetical protein D3C79_1007860 [compost metagenome]
MPAQEVTNGLHVGQAAGEGQRPRFGDRVDALARHLAVTVAVAVFPQPLVFLAHGDVAGVPGELLKCHGGSYRLIIARRMVPPSDRSRDSRR